MFVSLAASNQGLISTPTDWVLDTVLRQLAIWKDAGVTLQVAINISAQDLGREELLKMTLALLSLYDLPPSCVF